MELKRRGHSKELIQQVVYENPKKFFSQSKAFMG
jgi:predicted metal-dependent phosphotriesterase family hydrolase